MRILINAAVIRSEGGVNLLQSLLSAFLAVLPQESSVILYLNNELVDRFQNTDARIQLMPFRPSGWLTRFLWEQFVLPADCLKRKVDLLFSFANTGPLFSPCPQVLYVQQSIPYAKFMPAQNKLRWRLFACLYGFLMGIAQLGSKRIIVPTSWLIPPMRRSVLGLVPEKRYQVSVPGLRALSEEGELSEKERELIARVDICKHAGHKIVFYPAYLAPYKHIPYLLESIDQLRKRDLSFRLLLTFDRESPEYFPCKKEIFDTVEKLGLTDQEVIFCGHLSRPAMTRMYRLTDVLAFPSQVETLGLPLLEALGSGIPIVACDTPFAREVCAEAALYADSFSPEMFCKLLEQAMRHDDARLKREQRAKSFSWERHARDILGL